MRKYKVLDVRELEDRIILIAEYTDDDYLKGGRTRITIKKGDKSWYGSYSKVITGDAITISDDGFGNNVLRIE